MDNKPCLRCKPSDNAMRWCVACCEKMDRERARLVAHTSAWKWFSFGIGVGHRVNYWRAIFAPSKKAAMAHMRSMHGKEPYHYYDAHPHDAGCVIAERVPIPDSVWREE